MLITLWCGIKLIAARSGKLNLLDFVKTDKNFDASIFVLLIITSFLDVMH